MREELRQRAAAATTPARKGVVTQYTMCIGYRLSTHMPSSCGVFFCLGLRSLGLCNSTLYR